MNIEAMKLALEALENATHFIEEYAANKYIFAHHSTIKDLRQAIEQAEKQEPVALKFPRHEKRNKDGWTIDPAFITRVEHSIDPETSFDFIPTMEQVQETLLALEVIPASLFTSPPQRQPLTDEFLRKLHHIEEFGLFCDYDDFEQIARAIEYAIRHKEKT